MRRAKYPCALYLPWTRALTVMAALHLGACGFLPGRGGDVTPVDEPVDQANNTSNDSMLDDAAPGVPGFFGEEDELPEGAMEVTTAQFEMFESMGRFVPIDPAKTRQRKTERDERKAQDLALVEQFVDANPGFDARFKAPYGGAGTTLMDGTILTKVGEQDIVLMGDAQRTADIASTLRVMESAEEQLELIKMIYPVIPTECRDKAPEQSMWEGLDAGELRRAIDEMASCRGELINTQELDDAGFIGDLFAPAPQISPDHEDRGVGGGDWATVGDTGSGCYDANDVYKKPTNFRGVYPYATTVKSQGNRGSCVAFATVSALEYSISRQTGRKVNLSEQATYALAKAIYYDDPHDDGLNTNDFVKDLAARGDAIPFEAQWPYNQSGSSLKEEGNFVGACLGYDFPICSETSHQTQVVCTTLPGGASWCGYWTAGYTNGYALPFAQRFGAFDSSNIHVAQALMNAGAALVIAVDVTQKFDDFRDQAATNTIAMLGEDNTPVLGGHAMQLMGIFHDHSSGSPEPFAVFKNSWGCTFGNNGYIAVPWDWVDDHFKTMLAIGQVRSGANYPPNVEIAGSQRIFVDAGLFNNFTLTASASDIEDGEDCCTFEWRDVRTNDFLGSGKEVDVSYSSSGYEFVRVTATDSEGGVSQDIVTVVVRNQPPTVSIIEPQTINVPGEGDVVRVYQGVPTTFLSNTSDPNTFGGGPGCDQRSWATDAGGGQELGTGCYMQRTFTTVGFETLTVTATDFDGATGTASIKVEVVELPAGSAPIVTITKPASDSVAFYYDTETFDLEAIVSNPRGDVLTYEWEIARNARFVGAISLGKGSTKRLRIEDHWDYGWDGGKLYIRYKATDGRATYQGVRVVTVPPIPR